jgi:hypothetical protein
VAADSAREDGPRLNAREFFAALSDAEVQRTPADPPLRDMPEAGEDSTPPEQEPYNLTPEQEHANLMSAHDAEPYDRRWAVPASQAFAQDFAALDGRRSVTLANVDCRSTSCLLTLEWPDRDAANREMYELAALPYQFNCERHISLLPGDGTARAARGVLLIHCENGVQPGAPP